MSDEFSDSNNEEQFDDEHSNLIPEKNTSKKLIVKPHQKRRVVKSQIEAMSQYGAGLSQLAEFYSKRQRLRMEFDRSRHNTFLKFKADVTERNRITDGCNFY